MVTKTVIEVSLHSRFFDMFAASERTVYDINN